MNEPKHRPRLSVLLPVYTGERYVEDSVGSILAQHFHDFELIVIDDASPDQSLAIIERLDDPRIRVIRNRHNVGQTASLQIGLEHAMGEYVARQDQDDISEPDRLQMQVDYLDRHDDVVAVGTGYTAIDESGCHFSAVSGLPRPKDAAEMAWRLLWSDRLVDSTVTFRRQPALDVGGYDLTHRFAQDFDLWSRLSHRADVMQLDDPLLRLRIHQQSASSRNVEAQELEVAKIIQRNLAVLLDAEVHLELAIAIRCFLTQPAKGARLDFHKVTTIVRSALIRHLENLEARGRDTTATRLAAAEMLLKLALRNVNQIGVLCAARTVANAFASYPRILFQPKVWASWNRQRIVAREQRAIVHTTWSS